MNHRSNMERGQSLVIIAMVMVGIIALMGMAIDGGNALMERRRAQNAADAAAMAGTRLLAQAIQMCNADPVGGDRVIAQKINEYAELNGVEDTNGVPGDEVNDNVAGQYVDREGNVLGNVGGGRIPQGATGIAVSINNSRHTYFMSVVGLDTVKVSGHATAMTGPALQVGGGILPIAVPLPVVQELDPGEQFVVIETNQHHGGMFCVADNNSWPDEDNYDLCIGDPSNHNAHRGWLNLNYIYNPAHISADDHYNRAFEQSVPNRPCGGDPSTSIDDGLQGWASGECPYPYPVFAGAIGGTNGDFIHGSPGARDKSLQELSNLAGQTVYVPIFDYIYTSDYMADHFTPPETPNIEGAHLAGDHWPRSGGGGSAFLYHIVGFTAMKIGEIGQKGGDKYMAGTFERALIGEGPFMPSSGFGTGICGTTMAFGFSLWK